MTRSDSTLTACDEQSGRGDNVFEPGSVAGAYVIDAYIGAGGCGSIYVARHAVTGGVFALKVLHEWLASSPKVVARFLREVEVLNLLRHPNIVDIHDLGRLEDGRPFYAMEYLRGRTLATLLAEQKRMLPDEVLPILDSVCTALEAAHALGVVHRDVKPSNVFLADGDPPVVKLLDFGIAKLVDQRASLSDPSIGAGMLGLTSATGRLGTPSIMAPEQILGGRIDGRADIYALGVLLYRMLTGNMPFEAGVFSELTRQHLEERAQLPSHRAPIPPALDVVVMRCLEKRPEHRYDSPSSFMEALRGTLVRRGGGTVKSGETRMAVAIRVVVRLPSELEDRADLELDGTFVADVGTVLDHAEGRLADAGYMLMLVTGNEVIAAGFLASDPAEAQRQRGEAVQLALALDQELTERKGLDWRVHANVHLHVDQALVRPGPRPEIIGGPLLRTAAWAPTEDTPVLCATPAVLEGLAGLVILPGPGSLVGILGVEAAVLDEPLPAS